mgnify:CR=1 FL=1
MSFRILEHTADLGLEAWGSDLSAALDQAVAALAAILAGEGAAQGLERRAIAVDEPDVDASVVALLSECLYLLEVEGWLACGAQLSVDGQGRIQGNLLGEPFHSTRHGEGVAVKAITWHQLSVVVQPGGVTITTYVDC